MAVKNRFGSEFVLIVSSFLSFLLHICSSSSSCTWSSRNSTFDLHPLTITSGGQSKYYTVRDSSDSQGRNFTYNFNICEQVLSYPSDTCKELDSGYCPSQCINSTSGKCIENDNSGCGIEDITSKAYAYQSRIDTDGTEHCYHLGSDASDGNTDYEFSLINNNNPAEGVVLTYINGDFCSGSSLGRNREFRIRFECENDAYNVPDEEQVVEMSDKCLYNMTIKSIYGCPSECGVYSHSLCGSQGLCGYDWSNKRSKCFCYHRYSGDDCSDESDDSVDPDTKETPTGDYVHTFTYTQELTDPTTNVVTEASVDVTYDLSPFVLDNGEIYEVRDSDADATNQFYYYFNIMANVDTSLLPDSCKNALIGCDTDTNPNCTGIDTSSNGVGAAFQYNNKTDACFLAGTVTSPEWSLRDEEDPANGLVLTYTDGTYCSDQQQNREFAITFKCPDSTRDFYSPSLSTVFTEFVDETHDCSYSISIESALACPYECITEYDSSSSSGDDDDDSTEETFTVCGGKGMCAADPSAGMVRCLCDDGWKGSDCNTVDSYDSSTIKDDHTTYQIAIAVISIVVVVLIGGLFYSRMRYNSLKKLQKQLLDEDDDEDEHNNVGIGQMAQVKDDDTDESGDDAGIGDYPPNDATDGNELVQVTTNTVDDDSAGDSNDNDSNNDSNEQV